MKGAQEAHEAIRPTSAFRTPESVKRSLTNDQYRLYNLIWQRLVASQMADATFDVTTAEIEARPVQDRDAYLLRATNTQLRFPGYRQVYEEGRDEEEEEALGTNPLPELSVDDPLRLLELLPEQHFTEPPARYTEASLVRALEEKGIGRPSTYAPTMSTIQERGYVEKDGRYLRPSDRSRPGRRPAAGARWVRERWRTSPASASRPASSPAFVARRRSGSRSAPVGSTACR